MKSTIQGLERGHMIYGPLAPDGRKYLFTITRVTGKNSVEAICHMGSMLSTISLRTHRFHSKESEWCQVFFTEQLPKPEVRAGALRMRRGY